MSITKIKTTSREEWLEERKKSLGGSDVGAVLGMSEYSSPYTIWAEKTGKLPSFEGNEWTRLGNDLEDYVAKRFCEVSGLKVVNDKATWRNDKYPHLHANFDRKVVGMKAGVECKLTSEFNAKKYKNGEFPDRFYAQCVEYLCVTEFERWFLVVLIYGKGIKIYQMTRIPDDVVPEWCESSVYVDDGEIEALAKATADFWEYVKSKTPPAVDGTNSTTETISTIFPNSNTETVNLFAYEDNLRQYLALGKQIKELKTIQDEMANKVKLFMNEAGKGESDGFKVSWTTASRSTFDHKRFASENPDIDLTSYYNHSSYRTFKVNEKK